MRRLSDERGQTMVLTVLFVTAMLGMAALVLDLGSWFRDQRDLQAEADAAALAGAQALPDSSRASGLAAEYVRKNTGANPSVTFPTSYSIRVRLNRDNPGFFSKAAGVDSVNVKAVATARSFVPTSARWAAPFGVDEREPGLSCKPPPCVGEQVRLELDKVGPGAFRILNIDGSHGGVGSQTLSTWILSGFAGWMPVDDWYYSDPGTRYNATDIEAAMQSRIGTELLFPVYRKTHAQGAGFEYEVIGWVGIHLTGFNFHGSKDSWIEGSFTRVIWEGIDSAPGDSVDFGARSIELIE